MLIALALLLAERVSAMPRIPLQEGALKTLCPYSYMKDVMDIRVPRVIHKVECLGKDTPGEDIVYLDSNREFNQTCRCTEIYTQILVVYNHPRSGTKEAELPVPIGCACVKPVANPVKRLESQLIVR